MHTLVFFSGIKSIKLTFNCFRVASVGRFVFRYDVLNYFSMMAQCKAIEFMSSSRALPTLYLIISIFLCIGNDGRNLCAANLIKSRNTVPVLEREIRLFWLESHRVMVERRCKNLVLDH